MLTPEDLRLPSDWPLYVGYDTGTFMSALFATLCPDPFGLIFLEEFPNYRYVGGEIELLGYSNKQWAESVFARYNHYKPGTSRIRGWVDENTQFRQELGYYGLALIGNPKRLELRVEITRQYVNATDPFRCYLTPWLSVLPYEMEHAVWPDGTTTTGKYERLKSFDHTLDCAEHIASQKPRTRTIVANPHESFLDRFLRENRSPSIPGSHLDPHLGRH